MGAEKSDDELEAELLAMFENDTPLETQTLHTDDD